MVLVAVVPAASAVLVAWLFAVGLVAEPQQYLVGAYPVVGLVETSLGGRNLVRTCLVARTPEGHSLVVRTCSAFALSDPVTSAVAVGRIYLGRHLHLSS